MQELTLPAGQHGIAWQRHHQDAGRARARLAMYRWLRTAVNALKPDVRRFHVNLYVAAFVAATVFAAVVAHW